MADPCVYCGNPPDALDHVWPHSRGGEDGEENRAPACERCDQIKGNANVLQFLVARSMARARIARRKRFINATYQQRISAERAITMNLLRQRTHPNDWKQEDRHDVQ
jgi:hypothetical protein